MKKDLISVIIPMRKNEKNESLPSIKRQTYKKIEIIEIVDEKLKGAGWARNQGLKKAKGEYIFYCDDDLELEPDCLENLYNTLKDNKDKDWAFGRFTIDGVEFNLNKKELPENKYSRDFIDYFHGVSTMSLIRAKVKPRFDETFKRYDDWDLWIRLARGGHLPVFCDSLLFRTVNRPNGISMQSNAELWLRKLYEKHLKRIADIIIPHHNRHDLLAKCLAGIDNSIFYIHIESGGSFAENCNRGAKNAKTDTLIFLNDDTEPTMDALIALVEDKNDITGIAQYIPSVRRVKYGIGFCEQTFNRKLCDNINDILIPSGFCFKIKRNVWNDLNGFDEIYKNGAEDIDLFLRAKEKKYKFGYIVDKKITHLLSKSEGRFDRAGENDKILEKRWLNKIVKKNKKREDKIKLGVNFYQAINDFILRGEEYHKGDYVECDGELYLRLKDKKCII